MLYARFLKLSDRYELISKHLLIIPYNNINDNDDDNHGTHNDNSESSTDDTE